MVSAARTILGRHVLRCRFLALTLTATGRSQVATDATLRRNITHVPQAYMPTSAEKRDRTPTLAETADTDAKPFPEREALGGELIDLVANSEDDLLRQPDSRE